MNSRAKGCRGEREFRDVLRAHGFEARRGQQYAGGGDSPDVISNVPGVHWEVKRVEAGNPYNWLQQAIRDGEGSGAIPIVAHKRNGQEWIAVLRMDDLIHLLKQAGGQDGRS
jgi:Holliday junction resolvase